MSLKNIEHCLLRATECERLAETALDPHYRETLILVGSRWRALAEDEQAYDTVLQNAQDRSDAGRPP